MKPFYLSGPMSNIPRFNFPAFIEASAALRSQGYEIISPHEQDSEETRAMALASPDGAHTGQGESWGTCLSRDVKIVADETQGTVFLPDWQKSRGARLEAFTGLLCGHKFYVYDNVTEDLYPISADDVRTTLRGNMP